MQHGEKKQSSIDIFKYESILKKTQSDISNESSVRTNDQAIIQL